MKSILMSYMMVIKNPQNACKICFQPVLMTFMYDIKIHIIMDEAHCVKFFL